LVHIKRISNSCSFSLEKFPKNQNFLLQLFSMSTSPQSFQVRLRKLTCLEKVSSWRRTEPYLWVVMFKIDGSCVQLSESFQLEGEAEFFFSQGSQGNLGGDPMDKGENLLIPSTVGGWESALSPISVPFFNYTIPGMLGVIAVLMEKKNVSMAGAEAGHKALNERVRKAVNQALKGFDVKKIDVENIQDSIKQYFSDQVDGFIHEIEEAVTQAVMQSQNILQNIWSFIDRDELIGFHVWDVDQKELEQMKTPFHLHHTWETEKLGIWEIEGEIRLESGKAIQMIDIE